MIRDPEKIKNKMNLQPLELSVLKEDKAKITYETKSEAESSKSEQTTDHEILQIEQQLSEFQVNGILRPTSNKLVS
jgi:hypothetical protein